MQMERDLVSSQASQARRTTGDELILLAANGFSLVPTTPEHAHPVPRHCLGFIDSIPPKEA